MVFVRDVDPAEAIKAVKAASEKKWITIRDQQAKEVNDLIGPKGRCVWTKRDGTRLDSTGENWFAFVALFTTKANQVDAVTISEQKITPYGDTAIETGRAVATKKDAKDPVWDVRYTTTWVQADGKWYLASEHQSPTPTK